MNHYTLAEMTPGLSESFTVTITEEMMARFEAITGDVSPIHMDAEYAQKRGYPGRVVYGMLGASFFSTLAGVYLPGEHCLLHGVECKFAKPIFIGDTLTIKRMLEDGYMTIKVKTPCMITCIKELNTPRYMSVSGIFECYDKPVEVFDYNALKDDPLIETDTIGLKGSPTNVYKSFAPPVKGAGMMVEDAAQLVGILNDKHLI